MTAIQMLHIGKVIRDRLTGFKTEKTLIKAFGHKQCLIWHENMNVGDWNGRKPKNYVYNLLDMYF